MTPDPIEEAVARAICAAWGYEWDGDPREDDQVAPDKDDGSQRPSKALFVKAARDAITALEAVASKETRRSAKLAGSRCAPIDRAAARAEDGMKGSWAFGRNWQLWDPMYTSGLQDPQRPEDHERVWIMRPEWPEPLEFDPRNVAYSMNVAGLLWTADPPFDPGSLAPR